MSKSLTANFFERPVVTVARGLLGKYLVRRYPSTDSGRSRGKTTRAMITEVEAYDGLQDKASHASRGLTPRTRSMFGPAGHGYVYFTYGMHWMLNIVTGKEGYPAAVLIRGVEADLRGFKNKSRSGSTRIISGPARVTKFFKIDKKFNGKSAGRLSNLWIEGEGVHPVRNSPPQRPSGRASAGAISNGIKIKRSPRIGVSYAGPVWSKKLYRFYIK